MGDQLYRQRCDSCTHESEYMPTPEPIDGRCWEWHPELVWHEKVKPCEHGNYARHLLTILENMERVWCDGKPKEDE